MDLEYYKKVNVKKQIKKPSKKYKNKKIVVYGAGIMVSILFKNYDVSGLNIKYFITSSTLIGTVRHKCFIPWNDDIDICMEYKDYQIFRKYCKIVNQN